MDGSHFLFSRRRPRRRACEKKAKHRHSGARALPASPEPMNTGCRTYRKYRCSWVPGSALGRPGMTFLGKNYFLILARPISWHARRRGSRATGMELVPLGARFRWPDRKKCGCQTLKSYHHDQCSRQSANASIGRAGPYRGPLADAGAHNRTRGHPRAFRVADDIKLHFIATAMHRPLLEVRKIVNFRIGGAALGRPRRAKLAGPFR
jgi:hypothetical protein